MAAGADQTLEFTEGEKGRANIRIKHADGTNWDLSTGYDSPELYVKDGREKTDGVNVIDGDALVVIDAAEGLFGWDYDFTADTNAVSGWWRVYFQKTDLSEKRYTAKQTFVLLRNDL